jgi:AcrR family transcriptional regulator
MRAKKSGNTNEANAADRRQLVLRAAMNCFAAKGIQNSSMKDICAATGMRSGHIYYYFKNKEDIVEAAIELGLDNILARIEHMLDGEDIIAAIIGMPRAAESARRDWNITPALRLELMVETSRNERLQRMHSAWFQKIMRAKQTAVESAKAEGRLDKNVDAASFARAMALLWTGLAALRVNTDLDIEAYERTIASVLQPWLVKPDGSRKLTKQGNNGRQSRAHSERLKS